MGKKKKIQACVVVCLGFLDSTANLLIKTYCRAQRSSTKN